MKIKIKESGGKGFIISLPNAMLFSPTLLKLILRFSSSQKHRKVPEIPPAAIDSICAAIKDFSRKNGPWELVQVESAGGDKVIITI